MAAVLALPQPASTSGITTDITTDIRNTLDARERMHDLHVMLTALRYAARDAFAKAFCADLAALTTNPDKGFVDSEYTKFTTWKAADDELGKRIEALETIADFLRNRFAQFAKTYRNEVIVLLEGRIVLLRGQLKKEESDEGALNRRIEALNDELEGISRRDIARTKKRAAKKATAKRAVKKAAKKP